MLCDQLNGESSGLLTPVFEVTLNLCQFLPGLRESLQAVVFGPLVCFVHGSYRTASSDQWETPPRQRTSLRSEDKDVGPPFFRPTSFEIVACHPRPVDPRRNQRKSVDTRTTRPLPSSLPGAGLFYPGFLWVVPACQGTVKTGRQGACGARLYTGVWVFIER